MTDTEERDHARDVAVALENEVARLNGLVAERTGEAEHFKALVATLEVQLGKVGWPNVGALYLAIANLENYLNVGRVWLARYTVELESRCLEQAGDPKKLGSNEADRKRALQAYLNADAEYVSRQDDLVNAENQVNTHKALRDAYIEARRQRDIDVRRELLQRTGEADPIEAQRQLDDLGMAVL